ncbi:MAG: S8 family serine peptidase [Pyrinomonadaceae bacterium]|nr:S8 family serine peptidase [Pyrinomonadaceae bacterium]
MRARSPRSFFLAWLIVCSLLISSTLFVVTGSNRGPARFNPLSFQNEGQRLLKPEKVLTGGPEAVSAANGFRLLQPGELAVASSAGQQSSADAQDGNTAVIKLGNGEQYSLTAQADGSAASVLENRADVFSYVKEGEGLTVRDLSTAQPYEKIDSRLKQNSLAPETPVIIRFNLPYKHFYQGAGRGAAVLFQRRQDFNNARAHIAGLLNGKGHIKRDLLIINGVSATINKAALEQLADDNIIARVEPDVIARITLDTSVDEIHARETWQLSDGNNNPLTGVGERIAIIDTGVDYTHADLGGCLGPNCKVIEGWNFIADNSNPMDDNGHGTHVAATAAGNGLLKGVAPDANIIAYKVCNSSGNCASSDIIGAIDYATDPNRDGDPSDHVNVASMSIGGSGNPDDSMSTAVDNSTSMGVVYTIAAGNTGPSASTINSPGTARTAITVAAACKPSQIGVDSRCSGPIASFSSRGPLFWNNVDLQKPDVSAPGVLICAARWGTSFAGEPTCFDNQHVRISGTSMATPHVAGAAALVRQAYPNYDPEQVKQLLKATASNLGASVNDQGAGQINLQAAIPGSIKINANPNLWEAYTDPTVQVTQFDNYFFVSPADASVQTADISANLNVPGVTINFSKTTIDFSQGYDEFFATMYVDNNVARTGNYSGSIVFSEGGVTKGIIPIVLHVASTIQVRPSPVVDYGVDNPLLSSWTSPTQTLTITNLRTDISQTVNLSSSTFPTGITFQSPGSVTVGPDSSVNVGTSFLVDNTVTANGSYSGSLRVFNSTADATVVTKFVKFFVLTISDSNGTDIQGTTAFLHNRSNMQSLFTIGSASTSIYLDTVGPYDLVLYYPNRTDASGTHDYVVFREGISLASGAATVSVSRSNASLQTKLVGTNTSGSLTGPLGTRYTFDQYTPGGIGLSRITLGTDYTTNYFSAVSSNYRHSEIYEGRIQSAPSLDFYYGGFTGLSASTTYTNTPTDFKTGQIRVDSNRDSGAALPIVYSCPPGSNTCFSTYNRNNTMMVPVVQTVNTLLPAGAYHQQVSDVLKTDCPASGACPYVYQTPFLDFATHGRKSNMLDAGGYPAWQGNTVYNGLGPSMWVAKFNNSSNVIRLAPFYGSTPVAFLRQDFAFQDYAPVPYVITTGGVTVVSRSLPAVFATGSFPLLPASSVTPGQYQFTLADFPYYIRGQSMHAKVSASFDTTLADPNPPALTQLQYSTGGVRSEVHDSSTSNQLFFAMDAVGGSLSQVSAGFSGDGMNFSPLALTPTGGGYSATVPAVPFTKLSIRLTGVDNSNNRLDYTFELQAINPVPDTEAPTTSIASPVNGQTVTGVVAVQVNAQDNVGVSLVELYQDNALVGSTSSGPYTINWNTDATTNGSHTLVSKAYDASGNSATSAPVTVTVNHDSIAPTTSITSPTNGQTVTGLVTVQASATDNVGVTRVELYQDNALIGTDTSAPYAFSWDTDAITNGSHTLMSKAYDASGNVGSSATVTVTVNHDPTPPTVSLTAPAAGASLTGIVTVSADASDNKGVARVEFYKNNVLLGTDTSAPYSIQWNTGAEVPGSYTLTAKAYDTSDNTTTSAPRNVTVRDVTTPTVSITSPANNATVNRRSTVTIAASATDNVGVTRVEFFVNNALTCTDTVAPFTCAWTVPNTKGNYSLQARGYDAAGNTGTSTTITVTAK